MNKIFSNINENETIHNNANFNITAFNTNTNSLAPSNCVSNKHDTAQATQKFGGFKTANGNKIHISERSLLTVKYIFTNITENDPSHKAESYVVTANSTEESIVSSNSALNKDNHFTSLQPTLKLVGYGADTERQIDISERSLINMKNKFVGINENNATYSKANLTAGSLRDVLATKNSAFEGFKTGSDKDVLISEKLLLASQERKKKTFYVDESHSVYDHNINVCAENIHASKRLLSDEKYAFEGHMPDNRVIPKFEGFKSAAGRDIEVSEKSLSAVKNVFGKNDIFQSDLGMDVVTSTSSNNLNFNNKRHMTLDIESHRKKLKVNVDDLNETTSSSDNRAYNGTTDVKEFVHHPEIKTVKNKAVIKKSIESLNQIKQFFVGMDADVAVYPNIEYQNAFIGQNEEVCNKSDMSLHVNVIPANIATENKENNRIDNAKYIPKLNQLALKEVKKSKEAVQQFNENVTAFFKRKILDDVDLLPNNKRICNDTLSNSSNFKKSVNINISPEIYKANCVLPGCTSPILECKSKPRKSRKLFRPPFLNSKHISHKKENVLGEETINESNFFQEKVASKVKTTNSLSNLYATKSTPNRIKLQTVLSLEKDTISTERLNIKDVVDVTPQNALKFEFCGTRLNFFCEGENLKFMNLDYLEAIFLKMSNIDALIVPKGWFKNHCKWIIWKLASYETKFPKAFGGRSLTVKNLLKQLTYRYHRELYLIQRPALRKILENDDTPNKRLVLCVSDIIQMENAATSNAALESLQYELELTDGWYAILATIDPLLSNAVKKQKIKVGSKLMVQGVELLNCPQGVSPLEDISQVRLKLSGNSTRKALWDAKLGFQANPSPLPIRLATISPSGGKIAKLVVFIARVYPTLFLEKLPDGGTVIRSERLESIEASKYEIKKQNKLEKLYEEIEKDMMRDIDTIMDETASNEKSCSLDASLALIAKNADSQGIQADLTPKQLALLQKYNNRKKDIIHQQIQEKLQSRLAAENVDRQVTPLLKIKIVDWTDPPYNRREQNSKQSNVSVGVLSIWRPVEALLDVLKEGEFVNIMNAFPSISRLGECQISANRQTIFTKHKAKTFSQNSLDNIETTKRVCTDLESINSTDFHPLFNEVDVVGLIAFIEPLTTAGCGLTKPNYQIVYLTDMEQNFVALNFWNSVAAYGYDKYLEVGKCVACCNLRFRQQAVKKPIAQLFVSEMTTFSQYSSLKHLKPKMNKLKAKMQNIDINNYIKMCQISITNKLIRQKRVEPSISKKIEKRGIPKLTEMCRTNVEDFHLTGLDFESTVVECVKPGRLSPILTPRNIIKQSGKNVNSATNYTSPKYTKTDKKIAFLNHYGNPPPLSPIIFNVTSPKVTSDYIRPTRLNMSGNVASTTLQKSVSEVDITNRSGYIAECVEIFDNELQDYSPPLSLD